MEKEKAPQTRREALEKIRSEHSGNSISTQCARLEAALDRLGWITTFEASRLLDIYHPPARALNLRQRGYQIHPGDGRDRSGKAAPRRQVRPGRAPAGGGDMTAATWPTNVHRLAYKLRGLGVSADLAARAIAELWRLYALLCGLADVR